MNQTKTKKYTVNQERVDDIPLLLSQLKKMEIPQLIDEHFPTHGNWKGLSLGWVFSSVVISHFISRRS